ncbi:chromodomain Y-like protein-like [Scleropages formosus]|uniref:Chromodomain Y-like protein-like n=1 Tax=Scleropages formosus TaxID=113540 RepID=A0A0P7UDN7_SCLFO|nr:chromodomain Y-like protein-like [Scleropages formosus]
MDEKVSGGASEVGGRARRMASEELYEQKDGGLLRSTRNSPGHGPGNNARKQICRPHQTQQQPPLQLSLTGNPTTATNVILPVQKLRQQQPSPLAVRDADAKMDTEQLLSSQKYRRVSSVATGVAAAHTAGTGRRSVDLAKSGIKILVPKSPMKSRTDSEESPSEAAHSLEQTGQEPDSVPPEVALLEKPPGTLLGPGDERARMGTRPRTQSIFPPPQVPITPAAVRSLNGKGKSSILTGAGTSTFMEALPANGTASSQNAASGASSAASKRRFEERTAFDKRLRFSVRQTESAYRYRDIVVKKQDGFTHILLSTKSSENNSLNPDVMKEVQSAMSTAAADDSKLVLLSAVGSVFCFGLDFIYFIRRLTDDRKKESIKMAECIRTFVNTFIQFKKPIIVAVNGPAVGLGASILPLCDVVWANEKAWFQTPYTTFGQTPDACSSLTFPRVMGMASASEMLLSGRKLTAQEACSKGLVSQVFWPGTFTQEISITFHNPLNLPFAPPSLLAFHHSGGAQVLCESKALVRNTSRVALEQANDQECEALKRVWGSPQGMDSILKYLQKKIDEF